MIDQSESDRQKDKQANQLKKIGQYLIEKGLITEAQLEMALGQQTDSNRRNVQQQNGR